jgi:hypothetical protein
MADKPQDDNRQVVVDLQGMLDKNLAGAVVPKDGKLVPVDKDALMQSLVIYIVRRTHLGWDLGYKRGVADGKAIEHGDLEPEEED